MSTLDPQLDAEWLKKIAAKPHDQSLRGEYFAALAAAKDPRAELVELEKQVSELDLDDPRRSTLKKRRNELRLAISAEWRDQFGLGTRPGRDKPFPWPDDAATRWLSIYEYIEEVRGVWLPDEVKPPFATHRSSVKAWELLIEFLRNSDKDYWALFRDCISFSEVPGYSKLYSLMCAGEDDFHWSVEKIRRDDEDPPVHGLNLDYNNGKFIPSTSTSNTNYTSFARVTEFIRVMFETYDDLGRDERFLYQGSKAPAKLYQGWSNLKIHRPTGEELGTAKYADGVVHYVERNDIGIMAEIIDALWDIAGVDVDDDDFDTSATFESLELDDDDWNELKAALEANWLIELEPGVSYKSLSVETLAGYMKYRHSDEEDDDE